MPKAFRVARCNPRLILVEGMLSNKYRPNSWGVDLIIGLSEGLLVHIEDLYISSLGSSM